MAKTLTADEIAWEKQYGKGERMPAANGQGDGDGAHERDPADLVRDPGAADVREFGAERDEERPEPALTLYRLTPKDRQEPPFHFANVAQLFIVAARDERQARMFAADAGGLAAAAWLDETKTDCVELDVRVAGVVARDMQGA